MFTPVLLVALSCKRNSLSSEEIAEFSELASASGAKVEGLITGKLPVINAKFFIGSGKAEEIAREVAAAKVDLVIFNHDLSPSQERNLENVFQCRVLDRTGLILDIFARRARAFEGKLQVELAQLEHLSTRLVRGWLHLERQRGGIGLKGPGEKQLEVDRRLIKHRIRHLKQQLKKVRARRTLNRRARSKASVPTIALVGYTNVGKSTLFNVLTKAQVVAEDKLFATLDPTLRRLYIASIG